MLELYWEESMPLKNELRPDRMPDSELHIRRLTVDEALFNLEKFLNDAFMTGLSQVRIVHGKGTGTLRSAVRHELSQHPLVQSYRPGEYGEGGIGVTIVYLFQGQ
jgi:DNA mismatch repair protein MutS2